MAENKDGLWFFLDGKQRLTSTFQYLQGDFKLSSNTPDVYGTKVAGLYFQKLPEQLKRKFKGTVFRIVFFDNMSITERDEMFFRLNNGTAPTKFEKIRCKYSSIIEDIET